MSDEPGTDLRVLRGKAYATPDKLSDRTAIYAYRTGVGDLRTWTLSQVDWPRDSTVLDLGCGPGIHLARLAQLRPDLRLVGADASEGMLAAVRANEPRALTAAADAVRIPFATEAFAGVMANHMLYHVADQHGAVAEVRRVLAPGGAFVAVTNAIDHFAELGPLLAEATGRPRRARISERFSTDHGGELLEAHFDEVVLHEHRDELVVPEAGPIVRYVRSSRDLTAGGVTDARWEEAMQAFERVVTERVAESGPIHIHTHTGAFVCR
jgi:SAM-dependent methyltransferase